MIRKGETTEISDCFQINATNFEGFFIVADGSNLCITVAVTLADLSDMVG